MNQEKSIHCRHEDYCSSYRPISFTCNISAGKMWGKDITSECLTQKDDHRIKGDKKPWKEY